MEDFVWILALIVGLLITIYLWIVIPARMARERGRSEVGWVLLHGACHHHGQSSCWQY